MLIDESKQDSPSSKTSEEMSTSIQKLKIDQSDEKIHINVETKGLPTRSSFQEDILTKEKEVIDLLVNNFLSNYHERRHFKRKRSH